MNEGLLKMVAKIFIFCLLLTLWGCGEDPAPVTKQPAPQKVSSARASAPAEKVVKEDSTNDFVYSPIGQRDPFESLLKKEADAREASVPRTPLEKFDLGQFRIQAILVGKGAPRAMVSAPDGKNYILKPGLKIGKNNGVIIDINKSEIIVEESTIDLTGKPIKGRQFLTIPEKKNN
ncbi:pilus assembly protein PilP [Geopsychrobacter electrodiphilus]|uniref:pilus assembly protein PilP n=1 Tax=Geopsychrobacter electrodiphilus TaxID=225196 RepID=UPI00036CE776|nr:pilus assembly protein PilP [Geopsychrobacter electrodiphilus]